MNQTLRARLRSHTDIGRPVFALAFALACLSGLLLTGSARADVPLFAPTLTVGQPVSRTDFPYQSFVPGHIAVVPDPNGSGSAVLNYTVSNSDQPYPGANPRADLLTRPWYTEGSTLFTSIPVKIPAGLAPFQNSGVSFYQFAEAKDTAAAFPSWGLGLMADSLGRDHWFFGSTTEIGTFGHLRSGRSLMAAGTRSRWGPSTPPGRGRDGSRCTWTVSRSRSTWGSSPARQRNGHDDDRRRRSCVAAGHQQLPVQRQPRGNHDDVPRRAEDRTNPDVGDPGPAAGRGARPGRAPVPPPISIVASPRPLKAAFTASSRTSAVGQTVAFDATSSTGSRPLRVVRRPAFARDRADGRL